jgi:4-hydroxyphenylpyruvate dioxygenase and related hemolysins
VPEPQHVAFATADIFATARVMRDRGAPLLTVSNNYYEDLYARFALHPGLIDAMREFGILYDREEGGEFYHLYTPVYGCACSSRWSSASARMGRTGRRIRPSAWRRSVATERTGSREQYLI